MAEDFPVSPNLTGFLHPEDQSHFVDEATRSLRDETCFRQRLQELENDGPDRNNALFEAWSIRSNIKEKITSSGELAIHDGSEGPVNIDLPSGVVVVQPDGNYFESDRREGMSLQQKMVRDLVGMRHLRQSHERDADLTPFLFALPRNTPSPKVARCPACSGLEDTYGKTTLKELKACQDGCRCCDLVVRILEMYSSSLSEGDRVRIFAPATAKDTLRIWCQRKMSMGSEIPFMIDVFVPSGSNPPPYPSIKPAADISGDTSSPEAFAKVRYWLHHCVNCHRACPSNTRVRLPTRLVEVVYNHGTQRYKVKLVETRSAFGKYACLSHCWGPQGSSALLRTTAANYASHVKQIPVESLPRTFQNALVVTRRLGLTYLWIDSLCIIQGSGVDWAREAARMGSYYSNAYITISASWSPRPAGGCFTFSDPEYMARRVPLSPQSSGSVCVRRALEHGTGWPLLQRGWVYQERLLSPRVLHFGLNEVVWECLACTACECGMSSTLQSVLSNKREHAQAMEGGDGHGLKNVWRDMVERYTRLHLTVASDRFAAIAGIAKQMQGHRGSRYFAGLWEDAMVGDLLWAARKVPFEQAPPRDEKNRAPTWSWASVEPQHVVYDHLGTIQGRPRRESWERIEETYVTVVSISGEPLAPSNPGTARAPPSS